MNRATLTALLTGITVLIVCCTFTNGDTLTNGAKKIETLRGKIAMDPPDASAPKMVINLNETFFNLHINFGIASIPKSDGDQPIDTPAYTEYADMLKGAAVRAYDKETEDIHQIIDHYQDMLAQDKWEPIVKIKDKFNMSLLYSEKPGILHGIFATIIDDEGWSFVNIYGDIDFQKLGALFGHVMASSSEDEMSNAIRERVNALNSEWKVLVNLAAPGEASNLLIVSSEIFIKVNLAAPDEASKINQKLKQLTNEVERRKAEAEAARERAEEAHQKAQEAERAAKELNR